MNIKKENLRFFQIFLVSTSTTDTWPCAAASVRAVSSGIKKKTLKIVKLAKLFSRLKNVY